jgi:hypothetical protein
MWESKMITYIYMVRHGESPKAKEQNEQEG